MSVKRHLSKDSNSESPEHKKMNVNEGEENIETLGIVIPPDDASDLEWHKAIFKELMKINKCNSELLGWKEEKNRQIESLQRADSKLENEIQSLRQENSMLKEKMLI